MTCDKITFVFNDDKTYTRWSMKFYRKSDGYWDYSITKNYQEVVYNTVKLFYPPTEDIAKSFIDGYVTCGK